MFFLPCVYSYLCHCFTDFDGIEIHTKLEVNKPESFLAGQEEADRELTGPKVHQIIP